MSNVRQPKETVVEYERLNVLGKAVFIGGSAARLLGEVMEGAAKRAARIYVDAERAFKQGLDPNIDDAKVVEEDVHDDVDEEGTASETLDDR